jgi:hypothetical protein
MKIRFVLLLLCATLVAAACENELAAQLTRLQVLLRSQDFALAMASHLRANIIPAAMLSDVKAAAAKLLEAMRAQ